MSEAQLFTFPITSMNFCAWIKPVNGPLGPDHPKKYGIAFPVSDIPDEMADLVPNWVNRAKDSKLGFFNVRSNIAPSVHDITDTTANMKFLRDQLHTLNIPLEKAVRGAPGEVSVLLYPIERHHRMPDRADLWAMTLLAVRFDAASIAVPTWAEVVARAGADV